MLQKESTGGDRDWSEAVEVAKHYFSLRRGAARWRKMAGADAAKYYAGLLVSKSSRARLSRTFQQNALRCENEANELRDKFANADQISPWSQYH